MTQPEAAQEKQRAAVLSMLAALGLTAIKLTIGLYTNSLGMLSEALHSGIDLLAAGLTLLAVHISSQPADERHAFGHGKAENLSALAQTLLLFMTCTWVAWEGIHRLLEGASPMHPSLWCVGVMLLSMAVDINRVRVLRRVAREHDSQALEADALHFSTDILSSAVVLAGVLAVWLAERLHIPATLHHVLLQADTIAALLVAFIIFITSLRLAAEAINILMDAAPPAAKAAIQKAVMAVPGVLAVQKLRVRRSGSQYFIQMRIGVLASQKLEEAHSLAHAAEKAVCTIFPDADVIVHIEPLK
ncbi:MAG: cation transporter [Desulfovibrio sp.]|nr:cation transporter [Desulfovibrio sp.]